MDWWLVAYAIVAAMATATAGIRHGRKVATSDIINRVWLAYGSPKSIFAVYELNVPLDIKTMLITKICDDKKLATIHVMYY